MIPPTNTIKDAATFFAWCHALKASYLPDVARTALGERMKRPDMPRGQEVACDCVKHNCNGAAVVEMVQEVRQAHTVPAGTKPRTTNEPTSLTPWEAVFAPGEAVWDGLVEP